MCYILSGYMLNIFRGGSRTAPRHTMPPSLARHQPDVILGAVDENDEAIVGLLVGDEAIVFRVGQDDNAPVAVCTVKAERWHIGVIVLGKGLAIIVAFAPQV